jgi:hypothetical protein
VRQPTGSPADTSSNDRRRGSHPDERDEAG